MSYRVVVERDAQCALRKLDATVARRIEAAIEALADHPYPPHARALTGRPGVLRTRVGDYRILYEVANEALIVYVIRVAHRRESYRNL